MFGHLVPKNFYGLVFAALLGLTALTTGVAFIDFGRWNTVAALAIALCKAALVALFFMHLRWSSPLMRLVMASALIWLAILLTLTFSDVLTRAWTPVPGLWETSIRPVWYRGRLELSAEVRALEMGTNLKLTSGVENR